MGAREERPGQGLRLRHEDRQGALDDDRPGRHQLLPCGHQGHADYRRGATSKIKNPQNEIVAYSLNAPVGGAKTQQVAPSTGSASSGTAGSSASANGRSVQVKGGEFFFRLSTKTAAKPGKVTFVFKNIGHVQHNFKINGKQTPLIQPGKTVKLVVTFKKKGKYHYLCTVPGHAEAGMKGTFTVR
jgi:uncharacterized cupredoxin-like copper-binding protein